MKYKPLILLIILICFIQACNDKQGLSMTLHTSLINPTGKSSASMYQYNITKGYQEDGTLITEFDCPDDTSFHAINIKSWNKVPVVNGRLPTYEETTNGRSIYHYGEKRNSYVKPYPMILPRLAYRKDKPSIIDNIVVVIQMVQTAQDTIVAYRYLSGGCGGSKLHNFYFLTDEEVKKVIEQ